MNAPDTPAPPAAYVDVDAASFEREVLLRSRELPVLVDFWATWCAPCRTLGPILEKLAREHSGRFVLAKIDIDKSPELADAFRIQSVPTVVLLSGGRPVDAFQGAQPEAAVRRFLEPHLAPSRPSVLARVEELEKIGALEQAISELRAHLRTKTEDGAARVVLARLLLDVERPEEAKLVFQKLGQAELDSEAGKALAARLEFRKNAGDLSTLAERVEKAPADLDARLSYGKALVAAGRRAEGLEQLYEAARRDLHHAGDAPRKALIEVFGMLGWEDTLTLEYQRRLSMLLTA